MNTTDFKQFLKKFTTREERIKALTDAGVGNKISANSILYFVDDVQPGDTVVANKGDSKVVGIGVAGSEYLPPNDPLGPNKDKPKWHRQARKVEWRIVDPIDLRMKEFFGHMPPTVLKLESDRCDKIKKAYSKKYPGLKETLDKLFPPSKTTRTTSSDYDKNLAGTIPSDHRLWPSWHG